MDSSTTTEKSDQRFVSEYWFSFLKGLKKPVHISVLRSHAASSPEIWSYVKKHCRGDNFLLFFRKRHNYFVIDENNCVSARERTRSHTLEREREERSRDCKRTAKNLMKECPDDVKKCTACGRFIFSTDSCRTPLVCSKCERKKKYTFLPLSAKEDEKHEKQVIAYFTRRLEKCKSLRSHSLNYKGLPEFVVTYLKKKYPGKAHRFFMDHEEIFNVSTNGEVVLNGDLREPSTPLLMPDDPLLKAMESEALKLAVSELESHQGCMRVQELKDHVTEALHEAIQFSDWEDPFLRIASNNQNIFLLDGCRVTLVEGYELQLQSLGYPAASVSFAANGNSRITKTDTCKEKMADGIEALDDSKKPLPSGSERSTSDSGDSTRTTPCHMSRGTRRLSLEIPPTVHVPPKGVTKDPNDEEFEKHLESCGFLNDSYDGHCLSTSVKDRAARTLWCLYLYCLERVECDEMSDSMAVEYFVEYIARLRSRSSSLSALAGKLAQAPTEVQSYISRTYPGEEFRRFFIEHMEFKITDQNIVSLKPGIPPMNPKASLKTIEYCRRRKFTSMYLRIADTISKVGSFLSQNGGATVNRIARLSCLLSKEIRTVFMWFTGKNLTEKLRHFFTLFDGVFRIDAEKIHLLDAADADVKSKFLVEAVVLMKVRLIGHIEKGIIATSLEDSSCEPLSCPSSSLEVDEQGDFQHAVLKRSENWLKSNDHVGNSGFNILLNEIPGNAPDSLLAQMRTGITAALFRTLIAKGGSLDYSRIPERFNADNANAHLLMTYCLPDVMVEQFESPMMTSGGGKVAIVDRLREKLRLNVPIFLHEIFYAIEKKELGSYLRKHIDDTILYVLKHSLVNVIDLVKDGSTCHVRQTNDPLGDSPHETEKWGNGLQGFSHLLKDTKFLLRGVLSVILEGNSIYASFVHSDHLVKVTKCFLVCYLDVLESAGISVYVCNGLTSDGRCQFGSKVNRASVTCVLRSVDIYPCTVHYAPKTAKIPFYFESTLRQDSQTSKTELYAPVDNNTFMDDFGIGNIKIPTEDQKSMSNSNQVVETLNELMMNNGQYGILYHRYSRCGSRRVLFRASTSKQVVSFQNKSLRFKDGDSYPRNDHKFLVRFRGSSKEALWASTRYWEKGGIFLYDDVKRSAGSENIGKTMQHIRLFFTANDPVVILGQIWLNRKARGLQHEVACSCFCSKLVSNLPPITFPKMNSPELNIIPPPSLENGSSFVFREFEEHAGSAAESFIVPEPKLLSEEQPTCENDRDSFTSQSSCHVNTVPNLPPVTFPSLNSPELNIIPPPSLENDSSFVFREFEEHAGSAAESFIVPEPKLLSEEQPTCENDRDSFTSQSSCHFNTVPNLPAVTFPNMNSPELNIIPPPSLENDSSFVSREFEEHTVSAAKSFIVPEPKLSSEEQPTCENDSDSFASQREMLPSAYYQNSQVSDGIYLGHVVLVTSSCCLAEICIGKCRKPVYCAAGTFHCSVYDSCEDYMGLLTIGDPVYCTVLSSDVKDSVWVAVSFRKALSSVNAKTSQPSSQEVRPKLTCEVGVQAALAVAETASQTVSSGPVLHTSFLPSLV